MLDEDLGAGVRSDHLIEFGRAVLTEGFGAFLIFISVVATGVIDGEHELAGDLQR